MVIVLRVFFFYLMTFFFEGMFVKRSTEKKKKTYRPNKKLYFEFEPLLLIFMASLI